MVLTMRTICSLYNEIKGRYKGANFSSKVSSLFENNYNIPITIQFLRISWSSKPICE